MKRILTTLLALSLVLMLIPSMAFAKTTPKTNITGATVTLSQDTYTYTGNECKPTVTTVNVAGVGDVPISDCDITYTNNTNAGTATVTIKVKEANADYTGTAFQNFTINKATLASTSPIYDPISVLAGTASNPINPTDINLKLGAVAVNSNEFTIPTTPDHSVLGCVYDVTLRAASTGNFIGDKTVKVKATADLSSGYTVTTSTQTFEYDGNAKTYDSVTVKPTGGGTALTLGTDYTIRYEDNIYANASKHTPTYIIEGKGNYFGKLTTGFPINPKPLNYSNFSIENIGNVVKGSSPKPRVYFGSNALVENTDFTYAYARDEKSIRVIIEGTNNFKGSIEKTFSTGFDLSNATINLYQKDYEYTGSKIEPTNTLVKLGTEYLRENVDYTLSYERNIYVGSAAVLYVNGMGKYAGRATAYFSIVPRTLPANCISLPYSSVNYDGIEKRPLVTVRDGYRTLNSNDYEVSYLNNVNLGRATVTVTGKGNYKGLVNAYFDIAGRSIASMSCALSQNEYAYDGTSKTPYVSVRDGYTTLVSGVDYTVEYKNNVKAGTASAIVTGRGKYSGTQTVPFTIKGLSQTITTTYTRYNKYLTSDAFGLGATATGDGTGFSYTSGNESVVRVSSMGTVQIFGTGIATITIATTGNTKYTPVSKIVTVTVKPNKAVYTVTSPSYSKMKVRITKAPGVTKYQIRYGRNGNYRNSYYTYSNSYYDTQSRTFTGLRSGSKYYVKVRAYKTMADGQKAWGNWGTIKAVRIK